MSRRRQRLLEPVAQPLATPSDNGECHLWPVLGVSASGYYAWRGRSGSRRSIENRALLSDIRCIHAESGGGYGALRVHAVSHAPRVEAWGATASRA